MTQQVSKDIVEEIHCKVYPVYGSLYDLFFGDGWEDWTRISVKKGAIFFVAGFHRDWELLSQIGTVIPGMAKNV